MVDGDVEVALDLRGVEVEAEDAVGAGGLDELRDERGRDRDAGLVLAVLAGVAVVRQDGGDPLGGGAADGVDHDEELHVGLVRGLAGRLDDEDVASADALVDLDELLAIRELQDVDAAERLADVGGNALGEGGVDRPGKNLQFFNTGWCFHFQNPQQKNQLSRELVARPGFEPGLRPPKGRVLPLHHRAMSS